MKPVFAALSLLCTSALAAEKLTPIQEEAKSSFEKSISSALKAANTACGTKLKVKTSFHDFRPEEWDRPSYDAYCSELLNGVASMCERPASKKAIAKKVTGVACLFPRPPLWPKGEFGLVGTLDCTHPDNKKHCYNTTAPRNIMLWKGVLRYEMHKDDANIADTTRAVLEDSSAKSPAPAPFTCPAGAKQAMRKNLRWTEGDGFTVALDARYAEVEYVWFTPGEEVEGVVPERVGRDGRQREAAPSGTRFYGRAYYLSEPMGDQVAPALIVRYDRVKLPGQDEQPICFVAVGSVKEFKDGRVEAFNSGSGSVTHRWP